MQSLLAVPSFMLYWCQVCAQHLAEITESVGMYH